MEKEASAARNVGKFDHPSIERLAGAPALSLDDELYVKAFRTIATMRPIGMGIGRIQWKDVVTYGEFYRLNTREIEELWNIISAMDDVVHDAQDGEKKISKNK